LSLWRAVLAAVIECSVKQRALVGLVLVCAVGAVHTGCGDSHSSASGNAAGVAGDSLEPRGGTSGDAGASQATGGLGGSSTGGRAGDAGSGGVPFGLAGSGGALGGSAATGEGGALDAAGAGGEAGAATARAYPSGPFGVATGEVIADWCFDGLRNPASVSFVSAGNSESICLHDFYNPNGSQTSPRVLVIATAALWCDPCKIEEKTAQTNRDYWIGQGAEFLTALTENAASAPATLSSVDAWSKQFTLDFPVVIDPTKSLLGYFANEAYPDHLLLDLTSMKIIGAQSGSFDLTPDSAALKAATAQ